MLPILLPLSALTHHSEPGDPVLLGWIKDQIDAMIGVGDFGMVMVLGAVIIAIPLGILGFFMLQRMWHKA